MNLRLRQTVRLGERPGSRVVACRTQVQCQGCIHALRMLREPDAQLIGHLPHHREVTAVSSGFAFAHHLQHHFVLGGMAVGAASVLLPDYIGEIAPADIRGRLISLQQLMIVLGLFFAFVFVRAVLPDDPCPAMPDKYH